MYVKNAIKIVYRVSVKSQIMKIFVLNARIIKITNSFKILQVAMDNAK